jgi:hypothetical protein
MFRFNGFNITIMKDFVLATQGMIRFTFPTLEAAMAALGQ